MEESQMRRPVRPPIGPTEAGRFRRHGRGPSPRARPERGETPAGPKPETSHLGRLIWDSLSALRGPSKAGDPGRDPAPRMERLSTRCPRRRSAP